MKRKIAAISTLAAAIISLTVAGGLAGQQSDDDGGVTLHRFPAPPPLRELTTSTVADDGNGISPRQSVPGPIAVLGPPPARACISEAEFEAAAAGTGCACTCEEYARKPVSRTCDVACQGHYACWGPQVSDAELDREVGELFGGAADAGVAMPLLSGEERETMRSVVRANRGLEWSKSRMCKK